MDLQETLDTTGALALDSEVQPTLPLFLNSDSWVYGTSSKAFLNFFGGSVGLIVGFRRGLVSDAHFADGLYRTCGDSFLFSRGEVWDMGPRMGGWPTVHKLRFVASFTKHYAANWSQVLAGMSGLDRETMGAYGSNPAPYVMYVQNGAVKVDYRLTDNSLHTFSVPVDATAATISIDATIDFEALHGPGSALKANTQWPFGIGRCPVYCNETGYWGTAGVNWTGNEPPDISINFFQVFANGSANQLCALIGGRAPTYTGGLSLPLIQAATSGGGGHLFAVHRSQGLADVSHEVRIRDVKLRGRQSVPIMSIGSGLGMNGIVERVVVSGGNSSRFMQTMGLAVAYPLTVRDCSIDAIADAAFYLSRASGLTLERNAMRAGRTCADLIECRGWVKGESQLAPPGVPQEAVFIQTGGNVRYERIMSNYERPPTPPSLIQVRPWAYADTFIPMVANVNECDFSYPGVPTIAVKPVPVWATTPCKYIVDGVETVVVPVPVPVP